MPVTISLICVRRCPILEVWPLVFRGSYLGFGPFANTDSEDTFHEVLQIGEIHASGSVVGDIHSWVPQTSEMLASIYRNSRRPDIYGQIPDCSSIGDTLTLEALNIGARASMRGREVKNMNSSGDWLRRGKGLLAIVAASACIGAGAFASPPSAYAADATTWESLSTDLKNSSDGFFKWKAEYGKRISNARLPPMPPAFLRTVLYRGRKPPAQLR